MPSFVFIQTACCILFPIHEALLLACRRMLLLLRVLYFKRISVSKYRLSFLVRLYILICLSILHLQNIIMLYQWQIRHSNPIKKIKSRPIRWIRGADLVNNSMLLHFYLGDKDQTYATFKVFNISGLFRSA